MRQAVGIALQVQILDDPSQVDGPLSEDWRRLAERAGLPFSTPEWMLGIWRHTADGAARLRIVAVREDERLVGLGPFYGPRARSALGVADYRLVGAGIGQRSAPLAETGREEQVAEAFAHALAGASPRPSALVFDAVDAASPWPALLAEHWPGRLRPRHVTTSTTPGLLVTTRPDHEAWLAAQSSNFRQGLRRSRRALEAAGGRLRRSETLEQLDADLDALFALHELRFKAGGRATSLGPVYRAAVGDAAAALLGRGAVRLWVAEIDGEPVGAQVSLRAGDRLAAWNSGVSPDRERLSLGRLLLAETIRDAHEIGVRVVDLGSGAQSYKRRFADAEASLSWSALVVRDARYPLVRARRAPAKARSLAVRGARLLPPRVQGYLRGR
jgi:CelD/BcsL family acetyltransferase involved in cellulose biosynthesis